MNFTDNELHERNPEALVAGTFALMTTWADPHVKDATVMRAQRDLIARKIVSNLSFLKAHPALSPELRLVLCRSHDRWVTLTQSGCNCGAHDVDLESMPPFGGSTLLH